MKKNLVSIIILALLIVNIVLTSIMMFSVTGAAQKTSALVTDISSALKFEISGGAAAGEEASSVPTVSVKDTTPYNIADPMTVPLKVSEDGKPHYIVILVSLSLNNKHKDFKTYGEGDLTDTVAMIQDQIIEVFGQYTLEEIRAEQSTMDTIKKEILRRIHVIYDSDFVYNISFRDVKYS